MSLAPADFDYVRKLLRDNAAIVLEDGKGYLVEARLTPVARAEGLADVTALVRALRAGSTERLQGRVIDALTTNETSFYRDLDVYETLRTRILPELLKHAPPASFAIWSAACSTGQEPYTLAMLLKEHFPPVYATGNRILATDLSTAVLDRAREGKFTTLEVNRGLPARLLVRNFEQKGLSWEIKKEIRDRIEFKQMNLTKAWPGMARMDLVLLRNVLIYFDVPTKQEILRKVRGVLKPHGYLLLGTAETTLNLDAAWEPVPLGRTVVYRPKLQTAARMAGGGQMVSPNQKCGRS